MSDTNDCRPMPPPITRTTTKPRSVRLQAYVPPELAERVRQHAVEGYRPESREVERLLRLGLAADTEFPQ